MILRLGGVYADVDTECMSPLNDLILPRDTLVVSWENEFSTAEEARQRAYVRKRQVLILPDFDSKTLWGGQSRMGRRGTVSKTMA